MATQTLNPPQSTGRSKVMQSLDAVRKVTQEHEDRISAIKKFVGQPIDIDHPVPLFKQLGRS